MESVLLQQTQDSQKLREKFNRLASQWQVERGASSNMIKIHLQPSYQRIIGLGPAVLPLIFETMRAKPDFWFWALRAITGEDPVSAGHAGDLPAMTQDWLTWARERGFSVAATD